MLLPLLLIFIFPIHLSAQQCRLRILSGQHPTLSSPTTHSSTEQITPTSTSALTSAFPIPTFFDYANNPVRGVNLGGWLVLEPWITPSLFQQTVNDSIIDEYTLGLYMDRSAAEQLLRNHWETWITEDDFIAIKAAGLNHVRIPVGYWSVPVLTTPYPIDPYIPGAWPYLLRALNWAKRHSIHVIVDLHGAPGSQNGYDNSGQRTPDPQWALHPEHISQTLQTIEFITSSIGGLIDILELLNEGSGFRGEQWSSSILQFYRDGYNVVRNISSQQMSGNERLGVMLGDAFQPLLPTYQNFLTSPTAQNVLMDVHAYQIFSFDELSRSISQHISHACSSTLPYITNYAYSNIWTVLGEWSAALTDCAQWLNGRGVGSRWDGTWFPEDNPGTPIFGSCDGYTGSWRNWSQEYKDMLRQYWEVQVHTGEAVQGWIYWTWKAENADEWSYQKGLEGGWIPQDPNDRLYPNICG